MIERFNFYDLYGYAFPGLAAIMVVSIPWAMMTTSWPKTDALGAAAVIAIVAALSYFIGHLMQTFGAVALPSGVKKDGHSFPPSAILLDPSDYTLL